jgi:hypothetical protein
MPPALTQGQKPNSTENSEEPHFAILAPKTLGNTAKRDGVLT